jgi:hypothetical protein
MSAANKIPFEARLSGGHPNSLGDTVKVVEEVLKQPKRFKELFDCYLSDDEVVRLRTSNTMKRVARENKALLVPYLDAMLDDISKIPQPVGALDAGPTFRPADRAHVETAVGQRQENS